MQRYPKNVCGATQNDTVKTTIDSTTSASPSSCKTPWQSCHITANSDTSSHQTLHYNFQLIQHSTKLGQHSHDHLHDLRMTLVPNCKYIKHQTYNL